MGEFVHMPAGSTPGVWKPANEYVYDYLLRAHARMTAPALVPPRSFSMSGITEYGSSDPDYTLNLISLGLPFHTQFINPTNNPANLQSQLQAGPRGNINNGAYLYQTPMGISMSKIPDGWSTRDCRYNSIFNRSRGRWETNLDTLGYEWAGIFEHGDFPGVAMNGTHFAGTGEFTGMNGQFTNYSLCLPVTNAHLVSDPKGHNGSYYKFCAKDLRNCRTMVDTASSIWGWGSNWNNQFGVWKTHPKVPGEYNVYLYYAVQPTNNTGVDMYIDQRPRNDSGSLNRINKTTIDLTKHLRPETAGSNWELINRVKLDTVFQHNWGLPTAPWWVDIYTDTTTVTMYLNGNPNPTQYAILDAVKFVGIAGTPTEGQTIIVDNNSSGFSMGPRSDRTYLECSVDGGIPKTPFFIANSCHLSEYTGSTINGANCLGYLFAMLYSGLISVGTTNNNWTASSYSTFIQAINDKKDFGQAFLAQAQEVYPNKLFVSDEQYQLIGAGNLKAEAYIPFGSPLLANTSVDSVIDVDYPSAVTLKNYIVNPTGDVSIGAVRQIKVTGESHFKNGSKVHLYVHN
jgi:hypothetical protein